MYDTVRPILLYVEDDIFTQHIVEESLTAAGYRVVTACGGTEALDELAGIGTALSCLLTDVDLGDGVDGWRLAREARAISACVAVVYVSGASAKDWSTKGVKQSIMVPKPFAPEKVLAAVASLFPDGVR